ncbi:MAG: right-handed parallel beta-helix repeat-containing protein [Candidatus Atribacteria bacterium]|nr:right-handed parallel beta-helix repeat-containing protein [Candidatus Atribacteria bacterium]
MKGASKHFKYYFHLFAIILFLLFLVSCDGITPTTYTITATSGPGGSISPSGEVRITEGESQEFTITPDECHQIAEVLVDGVSQGSIATYTFDNVNQNGTIQASFTSVKIYNVDTGDAYDTIQGAIDASHPGDTIIVCPGTYNENIVLGNKNITLRSTDPLNPSVVAATIIDAGESGSVVEFTGGDTSTLKGFKITNGNASYGGGISVISSSPTITNNTITNNTAYSGGGIYLYESSPEIIGNSIRDNLANVGSGIIIAYFSYPHISDNSITNNTATYAGGGIYVVNHCSPFIRNNTIQENIAKGHGGIGHGGGIYVIDESSPTVEDNIIRENKSRDYGGGIYVSLNSKLLPDIPRPTGWDTSRENIPTGSPFTPAEGVEFTIASNKFVGNEHGDPSGYTEGAHVYFSTW